MILDRTTERLRSKHVRTLELLQQTLDENVELRDKLAKFQSGSLHIDAGMPSSGLPTPRAPSNRTAALEEEMERLKAEHCRTLVEAQDASRARLSELTSQVGTLQNQVASLEIGLRSARETLRQERFDWHKEREALRTEVVQLKALAESSSAEVEQQRRQEQQKLNEKLEAVDRIRSQQKIELDGLEQSLATNAQQLLESQRELEECRVRAATLDEQLTLSRQLERELSTEINALRARETELMQTVSSLQQQRPSSAAAKKLQVQQASLVSKLQELEARNALLLNENRALRDQIAALQTQFDRMEPASPPRTGSVFAVHVDLKRENQQLRAQVEELKQLQRKFLTTAKKKTIAFPAL